MVRRFFKTILCTTLSFVMMTGTILVGAEQKTTTLSTRIPEIKISKEMLKAKQAKASVAASQLNATNVYNMTDYERITNQWSKRQNVIQYLGSSSANEYVKVGTIRVGIDGTVIIPCAVYTNSTGLEEDTKEGRLTLCYDGKPTSIIARQNDDGLIWIGGLKAGTYALYTESACQIANTGVSAAFGACVISSQNHRMISGDEILSASTGATTYQQFKVKKRGVAGLKIYKENSAGRISEVTYSIQKLNKKKWKNVATNLYGKIDDKYIVTTGLAAGTYRIVTKTGSGEIFHFINANQTAADSYGTSKKKAKEIKRKKSKKQVFLSNDSLKKTHWYKIKVKKTGTTYIDITGLGNESKISVAVIGKSKLRSKSIEKGFRIYGKAKKGTYYIKISKGSKGTSGYQIKYTK